MIKIFLSIYFIFTLTLIHSSDFNCLESWYETNQISEIRDDIINIKSSVLINDSSIKDIELFIDKALQKIRIDYDDNILILEKDKSIKIFTNTNQLFIDQPDTNFQNIILSIFSDKYRYLFNDSIELPNNRYLIKNQLSFNQIELAYNDDCRKIKFIRLESDQFNIYIDNIKFSIVSNNNYFKIDYNYFQYDLRNEN